MSLSSGGFHFTNAQLLSVIQAIPDCIYIKDDQGRNLIINKAFEDAFGLRQSDVAGKTDEELLPAELAAACRLSDEIVLSRGQSYRFEERSPGPDGNERDFETIKSPLFDEEGRVIGLVGISRDITSRKTVERALAESEERFRGLFENTTIGLYRTTPDGRIILVNPATLRMLGYDTLEEIAQRNLEEQGFEPGYERANFKARIEREGEIRGLESAWKRKDGTTIHIRESVRAFRGADGRVLYYEGTVEDVTARHEAEVKRKASETRYHRLFENSLHGVYQSTPEGRFLSANPACFRMFGYSSEEEYKSIDVRDQYVDPEDRRKFLEEIQKCGHVRNREVHLRRKDGSTIYALVNAQAVRNENGEVIFEGILTDITTQKNAERTLAAALAEKNILIKEIHHRVKNNMQVISSLLNLQSRYLKHPADVEIFKDCQRRIRSMSLIHEKLYQSKSLSRIEFGGYLQSLAENLRIAAPREQGRVAFHQEMEEVFLDIQTAIPCGLIVNELVSNALKHAFPGERSGEIFIGLRLGENNTIIATVRDNGIGLPLGFDIRAADSMGLQLVTMLVDQIDGRLDMDRTSGTEFRLEFRETKTKPRS
jgi:PAS domain S-box-containing protein